MKTRVQKLVFALTLLAILNHPLSTLRAQGTAFTYQGRLSDAGASANGTNYGMLFHVYDAATNGNSLGNLSIASVVVSNGVFTVPLDFGAGVFTGPDRWLEIAVQKNGGSFTTIVPRQPITPAPYAILAGSADVLSSLTVQQNTNGAPNLIGGASYNYVSNGVIGATISGGGATNYSGFKYTNSVTGSFGTVGGGMVNSADYAAVVSGGYSNLASGPFSTVGGGELNIASGFAATVGGGYQNLVVGGDSDTIAGGGNNIAGSIIGYNTVSGGFENSATGGLSTVCGGEDNTVSGAYSTAAGGANNAVSGNFSFAAGFRAKANHWGSFVWSDFQGADFATTATNQFLIRAAGGVGINNNNPQAPLHITGGGDANLTSGGNLISGQVSGQNLVIDNNEIISRNGGLGSDLVLNFGSGNVGIGRNPAANRLEVAGDASKLTAGSWLANSDARIKTDVQTVTNALDKLSRVRLVQFRYTDDYRAAHPGVEDREYLNVVAQEFQKVFPEDVKRSGEKLANGDDILQVDTYPLTIYSAAAVQELNQKLTSELKRRDAENAELRQRLEKLEKLVNQK